MAEYNVNFTASAAREFRTLPIEVKEKIADHIDALRQDPRPAGVRKLIDREKIYRIRIGNYRRVYEIDDRKKSILVTRVRHRR